MVVIRSALGLKSISWSIGQSVGEGNVDGKSSRPTERCNLARHRFAFPVPRLFLQFDHERHILRNMPTGTTRLTSKAKRSPKAERLKENDSLNRHPERVHARHFQVSAFFDPRDLVQVKYEMLREVSHEGASKAQAATSYGMSRQAFYQALNAFTLGGIAGLLPGQRGPKGAHKLTDKVMAFIAQRQADDPGLHARALAEALREELHLVVHPRSIERALARKKKR